MPFWKMISLFGKIIIGNLENNANLENDNAILMPFKKTSAILENDNCYFGNQNPNFGNLQRY